MYFDIKTKLKWGGNIFYKNISGDGNRQHSNRSQDLYGSAWKCGLNDKIDWFLLCLRDWVYELLRYFLNLMIDVFKEDSDLNEQKRPKFERPVPWNVLLFKYFLLHQRQLHKCNKYNYNPFQITSYNTFPHRHRKISRPFFFQLSHTSIILTVANSHIRNFFLATGTAFLLTPKCPKFTEYAQKNSGFLVTRDKIFIKFVYLQSYLRSKFSINTTHLTLYPSQTQHKHKTKRHSLNC
jgi:hypothetical protein